MMYRAKRRESIIAFLMLSQVTYRIHTLSTFNGNQIYIKGVTKMAQTSELVGRKAKFVMGTKLAKGGQYNFTLQNLKDGATPDAIYAVSEALTDVFDASCDEIYAVDNSRVIPQVQE